MPVPRGLQPQTAVHQDGVHQAWCINSKLLNPRSCNGTLSTGINDYMLQLNSLGPVKDIVLAWDNAWASFCSFMVVQLHWI